MNIGEMHVWFRQYAQQMGMQNVRAILPEQIDIVINTSITDTVNEIIRTNVGITNDRIITDNSKIGQINALKYLYKVKEIPFYQKLSIVDIDDNPATSTDYDNIQFVITVDGVDTPYIYTESWENQETITTGFSLFLNTLGCTDVYVSIHTGEDAQILFSFNYSGIISNVTVNGLKNGKATKLIDSDTAAGTITRKDTLNFNFKNANYYNGLISYKGKLNDYLFLVDFSIDYISSSQGFQHETVPVTTDSFISNLFPIRLIDDSYLADTLNDFILKPRLRSPIMVIYNNKLDIYLGKLTKSTSGYYSLDNGLVPKTIRMSYIDKPATVRYAEDISGQNVDCDLPEYMHIDILKHAVDLYRQALVGGISGQQGQEQAQQREDMRNNYRNEGYANPQQQ